MKQISSAITTSQTEPFSPTGTPDGANGLATFGHSAPDQLPAPTPRLTQSMSPQEIRDHRTRLGTEVEVILAGYWQTFPAPEIKAAIIADWCDELQDWTHEQVVWALRKWRNDNPDKRPNPGHISALMKDVRGRKIAAAVPKLPEPARERISGERAAEIRREVGL